MTLKNPSRLEMRFYHEEADLQYKIIVLFLVLNIHMCIFLDTLI